MIRTLIYAMQSSGASAYTFRLGQYAAQHSSVLCIPDLWNPYLAPEFQSANADRIILKVVVTNRYTLDQHIAAFNPTQVFLFQRNTEDNFKSLSAKPYSNENGDIYFKFGLFKTELDRKRFPVMHWEDMPWLHIERQDLEKMRHDNGIISEWARVEYGHQWGFGGIHYS